MNRVSGTTACLFLLGMAMLGGGCIGPHYRTHQLVLFGQAAPKLTDPISTSIQANLAAKPIPKVNWFGSMTAVGVAWFKCLGIQGWTDYHLQAEAHGRVLYHCTSSDGFTTVDIKLNSLTVGGAVVPVPNYRFLRAEVYRGRVSVDKSLVQDQDTAIAIRGKLVWDNDGWFEIHPQKTGDVWPE